MGKSHVLTFYHQEVGGPSIAEAFGIGKDRDSDLGTQLIDRIMAVLKAPAMPASLTAMVMDFIEDLEPFEKGPFVMTAACSYYATRVTSQMRAGGVAPLVTFDEFIRFLKEQIGGGPEAPRGPG